MTCCPYAAEFNRIYESKKATDVFLRMLFQPTPQQAERLYHDFHAHLGHISEAWRASMNRRNK